MKNMTIETINIEKIQRRGKKAIRLLAFLEAKEGKDVELEKFLISLVRPTVKEKGNLAYTPHRLKDNNEKFLVDEIWEDEESLDNHFKEPHMKGLTETLERLLAKPLELQIYKEITIE